MRNHLHFICPSDHLETVINDSFKQHNYYITSPGNSISFDSEKISEIKEMIQEKCIDQISFTLSDSNRFIMDGMEKKSFSDIEGLCSFYERVSKQKAYSDKMWQIADHQFFVLSYYIHSKIIELKLCLQRVGAKPIPIQGMVYNRNEQDFYGIYPNLLCRKNFSLN